MIFVDRKPTKPNRMLITPESGGDPYYATAVRADEPTEVGTPINAETVNNMILDIRKSMAPIGFTFEWTPVEGGPDLSTAEKVADYYGFGTWEAYGVGRFALGVSDQYEAGSVGGEAEHTLTVAEMPEHRHELTVDGNAYYGEHTYFTVDGSASGVYLASGEDDSGALLTTRVGSSQPHNNMPPYVVVYRWRRIA